LLCDIVKLPKLFAEPTGGAGHGGSGHVPWVRAGVCKMSKFERLLMAGSTELPECRCGSEMKIIKSDAMGSDGEVRTYRCPQCEHELRLTMWGMS
jgi:hypothetical protein